MHALIRLFIVTMIHAVGAIVPTNCSSQTISSRDGVNYAIDSGGNIQIWGKPIGYMNVGLSNDWGPVLTPPEIQNVNLAHEFKSIHHVQYGIMGLTRDGQILFLPFEGSYENDDMEENQMMATMLELLPPPKELESLQIVKLDCWKDGCVYLAQSGEFGAWYAEPWDSDGEWNDQTKLFSCPSSQGKGIEKLKVGIWDSQGLFATLDKSQTLRIYNPSLGYTPRCDCQMFFQSGCRIDPLIQLEEVADFCFTKQAGSMGLAILQTDGKWSYFNNVSPSTMCETCATRKWERPHRAGEEVNSVQVVLNAYGAVACAVDKMAEYALFFLSGNGEVFRVMFDGANAGQLDMTTITRVEHWWNMSTDEFIEERTGIENVKEFGVLQVGMIGGGLIADYSKKDSRYQLSRSSARAYVIRGNGDILLAEPGVKGRVPGSKMVQKGHFGSDLITGWTAPPMFKSVLADENNELNWGDAINLKLSDRGGWIVDVNVDGENEKFVFDTGASITYLSTEAVRRLKQKGIVPYNSRPVSKIEMIDASGNTTWLEKHIVPKMSIGSMVVRNVEVVFGVNDGTQSLLGQTFLQQMSSYTFDSNVGTLTLYR